MRTRTALSIALACAISLVVAVGAAQAVVVDMSAVGQPTVAYNPGDQSGYVGVALVPGSRSMLATVGIPTVTSSAPCVDPALSPDLVLPDTGLCFHGGTVMHKNETFALTWDPLRRYWETSRNYLEQFLSDVAAGSGTLSSPYAATTQYTDTGGRAQNASVYGGGCIDFGSVGGSACKFGSTNGSGPGYDYPSAAGCPVTGTNYFHEDLSGGFTQVPNDICLTDQQIQTELSSMIWQTGMLGRTSATYTPLVVLLTPPGVEVCLDAAGSLCSANGASTAQFCSYHSQVDVFGTEVAYVVQPWTALFTGCDDLSAPPLPTHPTVQQLAIAVGQRLTSPISQGQLAAIVNPALNGWFALDGSEINDNGCVPFGDNLDTVTVGTSSQNPYYLQREFNNAGVIESDPNAPSCTPLVDLAPAFVAPAGVNAGDVVAFDGSTTISSLIVPNDGYAWDFGDGATATGASVEHTYAHGGMYTVTLTVTDRGGNTASVSQTVAVIGPSGPPPPPPPPPPPDGGSGGALVVHLQLLPQSLRAVLWSGLRMRVNSNARADGIVSVLISRSAARRAHIAAGRGSTVTIGRGTVSGVIKNGTVKLQLRLSRSVAAKLARLGHVTLTIRLALVGTGGSRLSVIVAGRY